MSPTWSPRPDGDERRRSAVRMAEMALATDGLVPIHLNELLSLAIWKYTEADGKFTTRFRSDGALNVSDLKLLNHEHVHPRRWLRDLMLADPSRCAEIMSWALGCVVTREEHRLLAAAEREDPSLTGWSRYLAAEIAVWDLAAGQRVDLAQAAAEQAETVASIDSG